MFYILTVTGSSHKVTVVINKTASEVGLNGITVELFALPDSMVTVRMHIVYTDCKILVLIVNHDVGILTDFD